MSDAGSTFDVIIIGAGVVGCSIALSLSRRGMKTLNVDRLPAAGYGSTSHSSAIVRPFYSHMTACALAHEARSRWLHWGEFLEASDQEPLARYTECGMIVLFKEGEQRLYAGNCEAMRSADVDFDVLNMQALRTLVPGISLEAFGPPKRIDHPEFGIAGAGRIAGGIHIPAAGYVNDPQLATQNLKNAALARGATFRFNQTVVKFSHDKARVSGVQMANGDRLRAPIVVNASGPHSHQINAMAGIADQMQLTTKAMRHEVAYVPVPDEFSARRFPLTLVDADTGIYLRPDGHDLLIGTLDPECDTPDWVDPDDYNESFTDQWTNQSWRAAQRLPNLAIPNTARGTVGLYDVTQDWIPIYDKTNLPGFYLAIGTSGNQFKNAPMIGDLMAELIVACEAGNDHDKTSVKLQLRSINKSIDLAHFSRHRKISTTSNVLA